MSTTIEGSAILVTGANRGIGQALVTDALRRGAARVYAGTRRPYAHADPRVTVLPLDITDEAQVQAAAAAVGSLDILVNNAGVFEFDDLSDRETLERHLAVNLFGSYGVIQAFLPSLIASGGVNQTNAIDFIRAGAVALGIGRDLIHQDAIMRRERGWITELARRYTKMVKDARDIHRGAEL